MDPQRAGPIQSSLPPGEGQHVQDQQTDVSVGRLERFQGDSNTESPCQFCPGVIADAYPRAGDERRRKFASRAFHDPCGECDGAAKDLSACEFCKHLRLGHLVRCVLSKSDPMVGDADDGTSIGIVVDWYLRDELPSKCRLCLMFRKVFKNIGDPHRFVQITRNLLGSSRQEHFDMEVRNFDYSVLELILVKRMESEGFKPYDLHLNESVDWTLIKSWGFVPPEEESHLPPGFKKYEEYLRGYVEWDFLPKKESFTLPPGFKIIDVDERRIVTTQPSGRFVTLSYIWGKPIEGQQELQATKQNCASLEVQGSLSDAILPATISDAMTICRQLGYRYLWVDRLCIVQDDYTNEHNKFDQIDNMDVIYSASDITIVDASGKSATDGMAGVSRKRARCHSTLEWEGLELNPPFLSRKQIVTKSTWSTRGWTFQEGICSENLLFFTDHGVIARLWQSYSSPLDLSERPVGRTRSHRESYRYFNGVEEYTRRSLTHHTDIIAAFSGVARRLSCGRDQKFGLPVKIFEEAILWQPLQWNQEPRPSDGSQRQIFPSWSWVSILGPVTYELAGPDRDVRFGASLAMWAFPNTPCSLDTTMLMPAPSMPFLIIPPNETVESVARSSSIELRRQICAMTYAWNEGLVNKKYFKFGQDEEYGNRLMEEHENDSYHDNGTAFSTRLYHHIRDHVRQAEAPDPSFLEAFTAKDKATAAARPGRILVYTQYASLALEFAGSFGSRRAFSLWTTNDRWAGVIWLTPSTADAEFGSSKQAGRREMGFLALSMTTGEDIMRTTAKELDMLVQMRVDGTWAPRIGGAPDEGELDKDHAWAAHETDVDFIDGKGVPLSGPDGPHTITRTSFELTPRINVMLVSEVDGVARRLGIGQVYMKRWKDTNAQFRTVVLE